MSDVKLYCAAQRWNSAFVDALAGRVDGIILGDLFCQKRMFENEWFDLLEYADRARQLGLAVIVQTPVYNTPRTFDQTVALLEKLASKALTDIIMVHDIGVALAIRPLGIPIWWDRFGFNRDFVPGASLVRFLSENGISGMEVTQGRHLDLASEVGSLDLVIYGFGPQIVSFGRTCYTEYFRHEACERKILCRQHTPYISSTDKVHLEYIVDGYTLLDKEEPKTNVRTLSLQQRARLSGITAYLQSHQDIEALLETRKRILGLPTAELPLQGNL